VDFESQRLLGMGVEIEEAIGSFAVDRKRIENVVAALDGEVGVRLPGPAHRHFRPVGGVELRLDVAVGDVEELEGGGRSGEGGQNGSGG